jgi:hypothetical protein
MPRLALSHCILLVHSQSAAPASAGVHAWRDVMEGSIIAFERQYGAEPVQAPPAATAPAVDMY